MGERSNPSPRRFPRPGKLIPGWSTMPRPAGPRTSPRSQPPKTGIERHRSLDEKALDDIEAEKKRRHEERLETIFSPRGWGAEIETPSCLLLGQNEVALQAWEALWRSIVYHDGQPVGTIAAADQSCADVLNYDQVFVRDFVPSALAFLMADHPEIVKNFLLKALQLQGWEKRIDVFNLGEGVMPASFKVGHDPINGVDTLRADFGGSAIGRVAPVDSGFWWIILLHAYVQHTGDKSIVETLECQKGIRLILALCLAEGFDTFPTLLCADGCSMIDRRMGVYGYPLEIQALFYMALKCAFPLLKQDSVSEELIERLRKRLNALTYHIRTYFWIDFQQLNSIYRYKTEEYSQTAVNKFNVNPDSIPDWIFDFMPNSGGYFIGNVSPSRMDFRWFAVGNCMAILSSLATPEQSESIMDLIEARWSELIGEMPLKVCYPAIDGHEWRIVTGYDPKNTRWSYHNGGSWPGQLCISNAWGPFVPSVLIWMLTAACLKMGRLSLARDALRLAEKSLPKDNWPEYYDGKLGTLSGKQARMFQTWSIAGYLVARMLMDNPTHLGLISLEDERKENGGISRTNTWVCISTAQQ